MAAQRNVDIGIPVAWGSKRSAIVPPKFAMVTAANQPVKNRNVKKPPRFGTSAVPRIKSRAIPYEII